MRDKTDMSSSGILYNWQFVGNNSSPANADAINCTCLLHDAHNNAGTVTS